MMRLFLTIVCFFGSLNFLWSQNIAPNLNDDANIGKVSINEVAAEEQHKSRTIFGVIKDAVTNEPILGATVIIEGTTLGAVTGIDGDFKIANAPKDGFKLRVSYVSYKPYLSELLTIKSGMALEFNLSMVEETQNLETVVVVGRRRIGSEAGVMSAIKTSALVASGISAAQISRSNDRDASEVIKRVPGISIIDDRFIIVRGLAQRYNNVWINGGAVPSSEADGRAFSFDILPSSQIESMIIVKSPAAENPGDVAGGFIKITTKNLIDKNTIQIGVATGINSVTHTNAFKINRGGATDFLGFDASKRPLSSDFPTNLNLSKSKLDYFTRNGFNNDWSVHKMAPAPDIRLSFSMNRGFKTKRGTDVGMVAAVGYSSVNKTMLGVENSRYGAFAANIERPEALENYLDDQYTRENKINAMYNVSFKLSPKNRIDFRNLFNLSGKNRLTERNGISSNSGVYFVEQTEMLYTSRLSYTGQLAGNHIFDETKGSILDWNLGYSYANKQEPDRRIIKNMVGYSGQDINTLKTYNDKIQRFYQSLGDNVMSGAVDYKLVLGDRAFKPELKAGLYGTYRNRNYTPREFIYRYDNLSESERSSYLYLPYEQMMQDKYLGADKVYADEITNKSNAYTANDLQGAAYVAFNLPWKKFNAYVGARYEYSLMQLTYDKSMSASKELIVTNEYPGGYLLPSANLTYNFTDKHVLRFGYGKTINRPEFREVSPAVYQDFDLMGEVQGNENLKIAEIQNLDLRYEFYPSTGETISLGVFYKSFKNPIEWNFIDMGGTYRYSFDNAKSAVNYGIELDIRKSLDFIGAKNLTLIANATYVKSSVKFNGSDVNKERDRAMQGQSPYIINGGFYYDSPKLGLNASVLYNRIGKRIIGIGKSNSVNGSTDSDIPDSYEMPRNTIDIAIAKKLGKMFELKFAIKDLLSEDIVYKQFPTRVVGGKTEQISQTTKRCNVGSTYTLGLNINF